MPIKLGLSLKDYYERPFAGEDSFFGYFSGGLMALVPIAPNFDVHGGVTFYGFGETLKQFNADIDGKTSSGAVVGTIGLGFSF